jgi:hypothetical protein
MSLTVTAASVDAWAVSGSMSAGKSAVSLVPCSEASTADVSVAVSFDDSSDTVDDDEATSAAPRSPQPARRTGPTRSIGRRTTAARGRVLTGEVSQDPSPPPESATGGMYCFSRPRRTTSPHRLVVQDAALSRR